MTHHGTLDAETFARLVEYAMGNLHEEEEREVRAHLEVCQACRDEAAWLQPTVDALHLVPPPVEPPAGLWSRIRSRLDANPASSAQPWKAWQASAGDSSVILRQPARSSWEPTSIDGVEARALHVDPDAGRTTMLVRMAPGTSYPPHRHGGLEECFVLEGDLSVGGERMTAGDYQRLEAGSEHPVQSTEEGCLLLISSSLNDVLLDRPGE